MDPQTSISKIVYLLIVAAGATTFEPIKRTLANECSTERTNSSNATFIWRQSHPGLDFVISEPDVCWQNNSIVVRQCDAEANKTWKPAVEECETFRITNSKCPEDLTEESINGKSMCLKISEKRQRFNETYCYGSSHILKSYDKELLRILLRKNIDRIWLPVKRIENRAFNPYFIRLPGVRWNKLYDEFTFGQHIASADNHCVGAYLSQVQDVPQIKIEPTNCNDNLHAVCFFSCDELVSKNGCPQNFGALSYRPNECYGMTWEGHKFPQDMRMLSVSEYYEKQNALRIVFEDHKIPFGDNVEVRGTKEVPGGRWAINMSKNQLSLIPVNQRIRSLCLEHVPIRKDVEMTLRIEQEDDMLVLTVYNKFYIWSLNSKGDFTIYCFAMANYGELSKVDLQKFWENESQTKTMYKLDIKSDNPRQYWCEAHTIFGFTVVRSARIVTARRKRGHHFAFHIDYSLKKAILPNPIRKYIKLFTNDIEKMLKAQRTSDTKFDNLLVGNVRIMDILQVESSQLQFICHVTVSLKSSLVEYSSESSQSFEDEEIIRSETQVIVLERNLLKELILGMQYGLPQTVRSTEYCVPEHQWPRTAVGQTATPSTFCLQKNGLPMFRKCLGQFIEGAFWDNRSSDASQCTAKTEHIITEDLFNMDVMKFPKKNPERAVKKMRKILEHNLKALIPADVHYLAKLIRKTIKNLVKHRFSNGGNLQNYPTATYDTIWQHLNVTEILLEMDRIYNYLMRIDRKVLHSSLVLNSTNILLDTFEYMMDVISVNVLQPADSLDPQQKTTVKIDLDSDQEIDIIDHKAFGVVTKSTNNFVIFAINPKIANVSGVALFQSDIDEGDEEDDSDNVYMLRGAFSKMHYRFLFANQSVSDLLNEENIIIGTFVPETLWRRLNEISSFSNRNKSLPALRPEPLVVVKIYSNDKFFQQTDGQTESSILGKIISISIPGHDNDLPEVLPLVLTNTDYELDNEPQYCSYWNYKKWAKDGLILLQRSKLNNNTILCGCTHLTPFAYLVQGSFNLSVDSQVEFVVTKIHQNALNIITLLGCSLSVFGVIGIFVTACTFRSWRQKPNSKVLLQLSAAIALQMILFCFVNTTEHAHHLIANKIFPSCIAIGALLHYSILVQFCWMIIIAYLQFKRYVQVFGNTRPQRFFIKSTLLGWGMPTIPVALVLTFDSNSYIPHANDSNNPICYPTGRSLYIGVVMPISLVILTNLGIFVVVIFNIIKSPAGSIRHTEKSFALSQIRLLVLLFFLLGFTWIFGLMTAMGAGIAFSYLFCLTATLQGFILFIYFILMDPTTRRMWCGYLRRWFHLKDISNNASIMKDTTQSY
ncbi:uncharacterized protein LOC106090275 [Stomoxys calcitrans]|uniref:uncharacterized protein LOC106090275 n=1 Tax=Stomoxys calcitrans TaxID=35570 RepID=UPI0027E2E016|nr:uncharacterized protein LOC106090275 [Stomoxys calcitrans]